MDVARLYDAGLGPDGAIFWVVIAGAVLAVCAFTMGALALIGVASARKAAAEQLAVGMRALEQFIAEREHRTRDEADQRSSHLRNEIGSHMMQVGDSLRSAIDLGRSAMDARLDAAAGLQATSGEALRGEVAGALKLFGDGLKGDVASLAGVMKERVGVLSETLEARQAEFEKTVAERLTAASDRIAELSRNNGEAMGALRTTLEQRLDVLRAENEAKLEQMRLTVDEKLQSTLEKRIGESFKQVSDRLEHVHRGLGEMQTLAVGVGDLKKVLSNVKDRGGWAEVQLGALLEQMLTREQYLTNVRIDQSSQQTVEYAIRLPGGADAEEVLLPIDAKFPKEDYERLVAAWDAGDAESAKAALDALEKVIDAEAKKIAEKYIRPPRSTNFAVMFLPTEGLFAEVMRRPGLASRLQERYKVTVAGPTTLAALLTSLQMGFRTLAIQKRSSEVWQVLGEAKAEFEKYADVWERLGKQLRTVQKTVEDAGQRTRAVNKKLKRVETIGLLDDADHPAPERADHAITYDDDDAFARDAETLA